VTMLKEKAVALVPNIITLVAMIFGLTAIKLAYEGQFGPAVYAILFAAALDFTDGFIARELSVQSAFGAELDSLADLVNFGVAPALLLYQLEMQHLGDIGWGVSSAYVLATGLRLARFNTKLKTADITVSKTQFEGIPSTFAAVAVLILNKAAQNTLDPPFTTAVAATSLVAASFLMLSSRRVPTLATLFSELRAKASGE
jgi:CDP-diacylglycerol--serine O-phosphatidyltransferase